MSYTQACVCPTCGFSKSPDFCQPYPGPGLQVALL